MRAHEIQIEIDDVASCPGSCAGCILTKDERLSHGPMMSEDMLERVHGRVAEYVGTLEGLKTINITYGIADHLMMPDGYVERLYRRGADLVLGSGISGGECAVFFTTSVIGRYEKVAPKLERIANTVVEGVPLYPVVVLDPCKLQLTEYGKTYAKSFALSRTLFGKVDLTLNLSRSAIRSMTAKELCDFASEHGFSWLTVNLAPTRQNYEATLGAREEIQDWLLEFAKEADARGIAYSYGPVMRRSLAATTINPGDFVINEVVFETTAKSLQVDHHGNIMFKAEAIGDVFHGERFGYKPMGNVEDGPIRPMVDVAKHKISRAIVQDHLKVPACRDCQYLNPCMMTGFHTYNRMLGEMGGWPKGDGCPHVAKALFNHYAAEVAAA